MAERASDEVPFLRQDEKDTYDGTLRRRGRRSWARGFLYSCALNVTLLMALVTSVVMQRRIASKGFIPNEIYSPAQSVVEYETVVFTGGLREEPSKFRGSTKEVDDQWDELYNSVLISQISPESAAKLPNKTTPFTEDPDHFIVELDVFHQLHCLNMLRKLEKAKDNIFHMEHCYEQLRQSLQCSSDISTIYWEWSQKKNKFFGNVRTTHTCKNFDKIRDWAVEHRAQTDLDFYKYVDGAPILHE